MYPLLDRDGLTIPYAALALVWGGLMGMWAPAVAAATAASQPPRPSGPLRRAAAAFTNLLAAGFVVAALGLHAAQRLRPPPEHLPWLYDRGFITLGFGGGALVALHLQAAQWRLPAQRLGEPAYPAADAAVMRKKNL